MNPLLQEPVQSSFRHNFHEPLLADTNNICAGGEFRINVLDGRLIDLYGTLLYQSARFRIAFRCPCQAR